MADKTDDVEALHKTIGEMKLYIAELEKIIDIHSAKASENLNLLNKQVKRLLDSTENDWRLKTWEPEPWLKLAGFKWLWKDSGAEWVASSDRPTWTGSWYECTSCRVLRLTTLNFTPPPITHTQQVIEL